MRVRNHLWSLFATVIGEAIFGFVGELSLYEFTLLTLGSAAALSVNLMIWDE